MFIWQIEEYSSLLPLLARRFRANRTDDTIRVTKASFGPSPNQHVLLCCPARPELRRSTCIFFIHGGGWRHGTPAWFRFIGHFFAKLGFPTLLAGYRLAPAHRFPAQLEDVDTGLTGRDRNAADKDVLSDVIIGGQSAGAHLASLLAYNPATGARPYLQRESISLKGLFLVGGPLDFSHCGSRKIRKYINNLMGNTSNWDRAEPIHYIRGDETLPVLCVHGDQDPLVNVQNSLAFINRFTKRDDKLTKACIVHGGHHSDLVNLFLEHDYPAAQPLREWLERVCKK